METVGDLVQRAGGEAAPVEEGGVGEWFGSVHEKILPGLNCKVNNTRVNI